MAHEEALNDFLVEAFNDILKTQETAISHAYTNLSLREVHVIEAVYYGEHFGKSNKAADLAARLRVTAGTLTTAVTILEKKGYLIRQRDVVDRRVIRIFTTDSGRDACQYHKEFHREMVADVLEILSPEETQTLVRSLKRISEFFQNKYNHRLKEKKES